MANKIAGIIKGATAYLLNAQGEIQKLEVGSAPYYEIKSTMILFVVAKLNKDESYSLIIPYPFLETLYPKALHKLHDLVAELSGKGKPDYPGAIFDVTNLPASSVTKAANELLVELKQLRKDSKLEKSNS